MQSDDVRKIKKAIHDQAFNGRRQVRCEVGRVINARRQKGQLQVKTLSSDHWHNVDSVTIE